MTGDREGHVDEAASPVEVEIRTFSLRGILGVDRVRGSAPLWVAPLALFVLTRLVLYLAAIYGGHATLVGGTSAMLSGWDAGHYLGIVTQGYPAHPDVTQYSPIAFFPGFPILVRGVMDLLSITPLEAGMAVTIIEGALFVVVCAKLVAAVVDDAAGKRAGLLMAAFPGTFILFIPYAEAQAVLFVALCLLATLDGRPYRAGVFAAIATFSSPLTAPLVPALLVAAWRRRDGALAAGAAVGTLGFIAYMAYLGQHTGDVMAWFREEWTGFDHRFSLAAPFSHLRLWPGIGTIELTSLAVFFLGVYALWRIRAPIEWTVYSVLLVLSTIFDSALWANPRILLNAFPLILALGAWLKRDSLRVTLAASAAILPVLFLIYMTLGTTTAQP